MKKVAESIASHTRAFATLPFFRRLEQPGSVEAARAFVPELTFFVMTFQDMLRLIEAQITDPALRALASQHRKEDARHEEWFLHDLEQLGLRAPNIPCLFGREHATTRDTSYCLVSEIFRAQHDHVRIALLLVLESSGSVFFSRIPAYLARAGFVRPLRYFGQSHFQVESAHVLCGEMLELMVEQCVLPPEVRAECLAAIERAFPAMTSMVTGFEQRIVAYEAATDPTARRVEAR